MINKIDHIGIAVADLEEGIRIYRDILGLSFEGIEEIVDQGVRVAHFQVGEVGIELLEPFGEDSPVAGFLAKRGSGLHHICYEVDDLDRALSELDAKGVILIDKKSRPGAAGARVAFLHPKSILSVLSELKAFQQPSSSDPSMI